MGNNACEHCLITANIGPDSLYTLHNVGQSALVGSA
jgi:hypothetical protein